MATKTFEKRDHYATVTDQIVAALEKGVAPWVCPWDKSQGMPHNGSNGHQYQGINVWLCWASGFADARWYTFNQVREFGESCVRKGEKGTHIVKWLFLDKDETNADGNAVKRHIPMLRTFVIFNHAQIDWEAGKEPKLPEAKLEFDPATVCAGAASLLGKSGAKVEHGGARAYYSPSQDSITLPVTSTFNTPEGYWATMLHELTHWTGHESRCDRNLSGRFGSHMYAAEELVAEMGSAFLCAELKIQGGLQHPEYIASWIKCLQGDKYAIFTAARLAKEAAEFLKGANAEDDTAEPEAGVTEMDQVA